MKKNTFFSVILLAVLHFATLYAQAPVNTLPEGSELITPLNAQPVSIDEAARRRGVLRVEPCRNLILFVTSGLSGISSTLLESVNFKRKNIHSWQGVELVNSYFIEPTKSSEYSLIRLFNQMGRKVGFITDHDFLLPILANGKTSSKVTDLNLFDFVFALSDIAEPAAREKVISELSGKGLPLALSLEDLEKHFANKTSRIIGCFHSINSQIANENGNNIGIPELVSSAISRLSVAPEGFFLVINHTEIAKSRITNDFVQMINAKRVQENIFQSLESFVNGDKNTLLIVIDTPESGVWKTAPDFSLSSFSEALKNASTTSDLAQKHEIEFINNTSDACLSPGFIVFAQGKNAELFSGLNSFEDFFQRLKSCIKQSDK